MRTVSELLEVLDLRRPGIAVLLDSLLEGPDRIESG